MTVLNNKSELKNGEVQVLVRNNVTDKVRITDGFFKESLNVVFVIFGEVETIEGYIQ